MKWIKAFFLNLLAIPVAFADAGVKDSLTSKLESSRPDSNRVNLLIAVAEHYNDDKPDSVILLSKQRLELARELHYTKGEVRFRRKYWIKSFNLSSRRNRRGR
jgi:hypothetical protein